MVPKFIRYSKWLQSFVVFLGLQMGAFMPTYAHASVLSDALSIITGIPGLPKLIDGFISPLSVGLLQTADTALANCSDLKSEQGLITCANKLLDDPEIAKALESSNISKEKLQKGLEVVQDISASDWAELLNDIVELAVGQSPIEIGCKVIDLVAGGFPICDAIKLLIDIGKAAYEAGKAILEGLGEIGCAIYSLFGGSCGGGGKKVSSAEFVAGLFADGTAGGIGLAEGLKARLGSPSEWAAHKQKQFSGVKAGFFGKDSASSGSNKESALVSNANLEAGWLLYTVNLVYPKWDTLVFENAIAPRYSILIKQVPSNITKAALDQPALAAEKIAERVKSCNALIEPFDAKIKVWREAGRGAPDAVVSNCEMAVAQDFLKGAACQVPVIQVNESTSIGLGLSVTLQKSHIGKVICPTSAALAVCESTQKVVGFDNLKKCDLDATSVLKQVQQLCPPVPTGAYVCADFDVQSKCVNLFKSIGITAKQAQDQCTVSVTTVSRYVIKNMMPILGNEFCAEAVEMPQTPTIRCRRDSKQLECENLVKNIAKDAQLNPKPVISCALKYDAAYQGLINQTAAAVSQINAQYAAIGVKASVTPGDPLVVDAAGGLGVSELLFGTKWAFGSFVKPMNGVPWQDKPALSISTNGGVIDCKAMKVNPLTKQPECADGTSGKPNMQIPGGSIPTLPNQRGSTGLPGPQMPTPLGGMAGTGNPIPSLSVPSANGAGAASAANAAVPSAPLNLSASRPPLSLSPPVLPNAPAGARTSQLAPPITSPSAPPVTPPQVGTKLTPPQPVSPLPPAAGRAPIGLPTAGLATANADLLAKDCKAIEGAPTSFRCNTKVGLDGCNAILSKARDAKVTACTMAAR
jgi:hypothetical protein